MNQKLKAQAFTLLFALLSLSVVCVAQNSTPSFFESSTLTKITEHRDCAGVRFYNVVEPNTGKLSTMAIGIRADNSEIYNLTNRYYIFEEATAAGLKYNKLSQRKASEACQKVKDNGAESFAASFTKEQLDTMLSAAPAGGVIIQQKQLNSSTAFEAQPGTLIENNMVPLASSQALMSGEPCPTFCGNTLNYVHM